MQPLYEVSVARPWHWGIVVASASTGQLPEGVGTSLVVGNSAAVVVKVRHAQDVDLPVFEGEWEWITATVHVRSLTEFDEPVGQVLYDGSLSLPDGRLTVGDADNEVVVNDLDPKTLIRVRSLDVEATGLAEVWLDLCPAGS